jgi:hypothetical protein
MKLRYSLYGQSMEGIEKHPQKGMKELGITYKRAEPQPIADQWMFHGVENVPETLPKYMDLFED